MARPGQEKEQEVLTGSRVICHPGHHWRGGGGVTTLAGQLPLQTPSSLPPSSDFSFSSAPSSYPKASNSLFCYHQLHRWFSTTGDFAPRGQLPKSGDIFGCHNWRGKSYWHPVARDAAQHLTVHRTPLTTKNELAQVVSSAEAEKR